MAVHETALAKAYPGYPGVGSSSVGEERLHPREIIKVLRRRRTIIAATILSLTSLSALIAFVLPPHYTAATSVVIDPRATRLVNTERALDEQPQDKSTLETEIKLLQSRSQARAVIEHAGLLADPEFNPPKHADASVAALLDRYRPLLAKWLPESWLVQTGLAMAAAQPEAAAPEVVVAETGGDGAAAVEQTIDRFLSRLSIQQAGAANVLTIQFSSSDPEKSARIANDAADLYIARKLETKQAAAARGAKWLSNRLAELRTQLLASEAAVATYRAQHELIDSSNGMTLDAAQLAALNSELIRVQAELAEKRAKLAALRALRAGKQSLESVPEVLASPVMANLRQQQTELMRQRAQESQELGPRHPRILQLEADQRELEQKIRTEIRNIVGAFERDVAITENRERMLRQSLAQTKGHVVQNNQAEVQLGQLEREAEANRALYTTFLERFKTLTEQQEMLEPGVEVISAAAVPSTRSFPQPKLIIAAGFTSSLLFATLLAFVAESLENGLRSGRQIEEALGLANLGIVPWVRGGFKLHHYLAQKPR
jgi:succinoglycan biosynthesis transport protein ExoP